MKKIVRALRHVRSGVRFGYPLCCVLRYAWDHLTKKADWPGAGAVRGGIDTKRSTWVPCGIFHHPTHVYPRGDADTRAAVWRSQVKRDLSERPHSSPLDQWVDVMARVMAEDLAYYLTNPDAHMVHHRFNLDAIREELADEANERKVELFTRRMRSDVQLLPRADSA